MINLVRQLPAASEVYGVTPPARFAITYTVKNEADLLPQAIAYHLGIGCSRIYIFFDGTTDHSRELVAGIGGVQGFESIRVESLLHVPGWIADIAHRWAENMDVRKRINTYAATKLAQREGIDWLINIDPDELLLMHDGSRDEPGDTAAFFDRIPADVDQILVPNFEAVATGPGTGRTFIDCTLFLKRFPVTEWFGRAIRAIFRRFVTDPARQAWCQHWYYRLRFGGALPRLMHHPVTGEGIPAAYFLGYSDYKAFIRISTAAAFKFNVHRWQKFERTPKSLRRGTLLHYYLPSADYFRSKYMQRSPALLAKAFHVSYMFAQIARELPEDTARNFFLENVCIRDPVVLARLRERGMLAEITFISELMRKELPDSSRSAGRAEALV